MEEFLHITEHVIEHTFADVWYLIPILYLTYVAMEWIEHKSASKTQEMIKRAGNAGPFFGSILGVVPQCGFSAMGATLYAGRVITIGTLYAIFLSTSDEMLPVFLASQVEGSAIIAIMLTKVMIGMVMGFIIDGFFRLANRDKGSLTIHELCDRAHCGCEEDCATCKEDPTKIYEHFDDCKKGCTHTNHAHDHHHDSSWKSIFLSALKHTIQVTIFIIIITLVINTILEVVGEDVLAQFLADNETLSVFASGIVGLIPNCAASIVIAELYIEGILSSGAMLCGLLISAGIGLLVLIETNRHWKQNLLIICGLFIIGIAFGFLVNFLGITF